MIVVADTSPLLHLSRVGRLDLVQAALGPVTIPRTVWAELIRPGTRADVRAYLLDAAWITVVDDPPIVALSLDPGETAAILLAEQLHADALLIDERRGRSVATARGLRVIGTLGVLIAARSAGALDRIAPVIDALRSDGFWLADDLVQTLLQRAGEPP
jgi:predicted nucleic acid-binding protein